ncbi:MAG: hypothetical protein NTX95_09025 [Actinobacteria bacterium]|nr:hypothetical protein [Actinomycetota bacterium]
MRRITLLILALAGLAIGAPLATAQEVGDAKAIILTIDKTKPSTGQLQFTIEPEGFVYKKVPYAGGKNASGQGHAHIYAKADGAKKAKYIGWTGSGLTSWTDKKMLKAGTTYRVFAVFSENDHAEEWKVKSNWVLVDF